MKRFFSALLVAILVVTCLSTAAFAATQVQTGAQMSVTFTVSGDEFLNYGVQVSADPGLKIVGISGATGNVNSGVVAYAGMSNVTSHSFTVTVEVTASNCGTYNVYASMLQAGKQVTEETEAGSVVKIVNANVSVSGGGSFEVGHTWGDWTVTKEATCTEAGERTRACTKCDATETEAIAALGHEAGTAWGHDTQNHWHNCVRCDAVMEVEAHYWHWVQDKAPNFAEQINGLKHKNCYICGHNWEYTDIPWDTDPEGGDMTYDISSVAYGVVAMISMVASAAFVTKRKSL